MMMRIEITDSDILNALLDFVRRKTGIEIDSVNDSVWLLSCPKVITMNFDSSKIKQKTDIISDGARNIDLS